MEDNTTKLPAGGKDKSLKRQISKVIRRMSTTAKDGVTRRLSLARTKTVSKKKKQAVGQPETAHAQEHGPSSQRQPHVVYDSQDAPVPEEGGGTSSAANSDGRKSIDRMGGKTIRLIPQQLNPKED
ncbi:hypothetical protein TWF696_003482 [Orbilia brochopaga]|uniref:Uncharacterized protein n=1 Tax=Orbilia brochopaga TaxID=3140254 RepID=A0AAV9TYT3_9PEZI